MYEKSKIRIPTQLLTFQTPTARRDIDSGRKVEATFQTPITNRLKPLIEDAIPLPKSPATKPSQPQSGNSDQTDNANDKNENIHRSEKIGETIKSVVVENKENDDNCHTPITNRINKFMMCFKSEPDLSRAQNNTGDDRSRLNRGRFIAKKLLGGVSMVNLRQPLAASNDRATTLNVCSTDDELTVRIRTSSFEYG